MEVKNFFFHYFDKYGLEINNLSYHGVSAFNTIENSFLISQLSLNLAPKNYVIFHNVAPRKDDLSPRYNNKGESLCLIKTKSNVIVIGVFSGYSLSFLKNEGDVFILRCNTEGSQFRSRDTFPEYIAKLLKYYFKNGDFEPFISHKQEIFPEIEKNTVLYIDGYGNLKTNIDLKSLQGVVNIKINGIKKQIKVNNNGVFSVQDGDLVLTNGSSGWVSASGEKVTFSEIFLRGGNASNLFQKVKIGDKVEID